MVVFKSDALSNRGCINYLENLNISVPFHNYGIVKRAFTPHSLILSRCVSICALKKCSTKTKPANLVSLAL